MRGWFRKRWILMEGTIGVDRGNYQGLIEGTIQDLCRESFGG